MVFEVQNKFTYNVNNNVTNTRFLLLLFCFVSVFVFCLVCFFKGGGLSVYYFAYAKYHDCINNLFSNELISASLTLHPHIQCMLQIIRY